VSRASGAAGGGGPGDEVRARGPLPGQGAACEAVLRALPGFFGIEESIEEYVRDTDGLPAFIAEERTAAEGAWAVVGLLAVATHSAEAAEIHVMGVFPDRRRQGIGRAMVAAAEGWLREQGVTYLTVKTLSSKHPDPDYAETRAFYAAMGFVPLMELPDLWDPGNPCLVMLKKL
jgi:GNAT superfamily N-acetyltransferase